MDRLAIARKALEEAEQRAGLRVVRTRPQAATNIHTANSDISGEVSSDYYAVPPHLQGALPGGLPRRGVVNVQGSHFLTIVLASIASENRAWIVFLGVQDVGWACAESLGVDGERVVHVPRIDTQGSQVVSAAIDGFDVVVVGNVRLDARERRVLQRRAISKGALVIAMNWNNASLNLGCELLGVSGVDGGIGHIKAVDYVVSSQRGQSYIRYQGGRGVPGLPALTSPAQPLTSASGNEKAQSHLSAVRERVSS